jgi:hypothetical protein
LVVAIVVCVCLAITPRGVWDRTKVWHRNDRCRVHVPLSEHVGHSLLWHPTDRSQIVNGCSAIKLVHRLD